ncbi:MAG: hypothetical protein DMG05_04640 [Acidobacteria bacterium]|nr:MAG: hypothetical protein DMG05_04640 [Acidobacteriota bacterium]
MLYQKQTGEVPSAFPKSSLTITRCFAGPAQRNWSLSFLSPVLQPVPGIEAPEEKKDPTVWKASVVGPLRGIMRVKGSFLDHIRQLDANRL